MLHASVMMICLFLVRGRYNMFYYSEVVELGCTQRWSFSDVLYIPEAFSGLSEACCNWRNYQACQRKTWTVTPLYVHPNECHHIVSILHVIHIHAVDIVLQFAFDISIISCFIHIILYYDIILVENIIILESLYLHILTVTWLASYLVPSPMVRAFQRLQLLQQQLTRGVASGEHFLDVNGRKLSPDLKMDSKGEPLPFLPKSWFSEKWVCPQ